MRSGLPCLLVAIWAAAAPPAGGSASWDAVTASYARVRDYTCLYVKEERAISKGEPQRIRLSFRKPLDVRMEWLDDKGNVDQVAVYRRGFNDGKLIARRSGVVGSMLGTLRLDPRDRRALEDSRHPITEVGLGSLIEAISRGAADGTLTAATDPAPGEAAGAPPLVWHVRPGASLPGVPGAARIVVRLDPGLGLPAEVEIRDAANARLERHRFSTIKINVGLPDSVFTL